MNIPGPSSVMPAAARPAARSPSQASLGEQLNQMSGVATEKNLYDPKKTMDKDAFLKMFMEQLKYQDPMNPVKNEQFTAQMATFSQLEQALQTNKHLEKMISQQNNTQVAALQLVGKTISADRSALYHEKGKWTSLTFKVPADMSDIKVEIVDPVGEVAKTYSIGDRGEGDVTWKWDGNQESGNPAESGRYSYRVKGKGADGNDTTINTKVDGKVTGVTSSSGVVFLLVGDQKIGLNDVETIKETSLTANPAETVGSATGAGKNAAPVNTPVGKLPAELQNLVSSMSGNPDAEAPDGSIAGISAGMEPEGNSGSDDEASQSWDRLNPLMPLYSR